MQLQRTTLRLNPNLKKAAHRIAIEENTTLQSIFNRALQDYLQKKARTKAKKIVFKTHDLGAPLDNLTRDTIYNNPK